MGSTLKQSDPKVILGYSSRIRKHTAAPPNYDPTNPDMVVEPPYPDELLMRSGILADADANKMLARAEGKRPAAPANLNRSRGKRVVFEPAGGLPLCPARQPGQRGQKLPAPLSWRKSGGAAIRGARCSRRRGFLLRSERRLGLKRPLKVNQKKYLPTDGKCHLKPLLYETDLISSM